jgi:hypothetical protein
MPASSRIGRPKYARGSAVLMSPPGQRVAAHSGADQSGRGAYREKGPSKTKHGEVAFPTQVRYDIVFLIRPLIIISALCKCLQTTCQIGKIARKH